MPFNEFPAVFSYVNTVIAKSVEDPGCVFINARTISLSLTNVLRALQLVPCCYICYLCKKKKLKEGGGKGSLLRYLFHSNCSTFRQKRKHVNKFRIASRYKPMRFR